MTKTVYSLVAAAAMLAFATAANAQGPAQLTDQQLDGVTAGAVAIGTGLGFAAGTIFSGSGVEIHTGVIGSAAFAAGDVTSIAASYSPGPHAASASTLSLGVTSP
jgi:hypothetical protein